MNNRQLLMQKAESLSDSEIAEVLEYISIMESLGETRTKPDPLEELMLKLLSESLHITTSSYQRTDRSALRH
ncbi:MAG TPA: hypothetical protein VKN18_24805 [Blastocatellia bacterium]|nr:hypothetical protein [Blastocatellia bacterium]